MKAYIFSLAAGLLVGVIYGFLNVRSPAPPVIALVGLFGILLGEQLPALTKRMIEGHKVFSVSVLHAHCGDHMFGRLPSRPVGVAGDAATKQSPGAPT